MKEPAQKKAGQERNPRMAELGRGGLVRKKQGQDQGQDSEAARVQRSEGNLCPQAPSLSEYLLAFCAPDASPRAGFVGAGDVDRNKMMGDSDVSPKHQTVSGQLWF